MSETATPDWTAEDRIIGACGFPAEQSAHRCPETTFWRTVILHALRDATNPKYVSSETERAVTGASARHWLLNDTGWFIRVCMLAGIDPQVMRRRAQVELQ